MKKILFSTNFFKKGFLLFVLLFFFNKSFPQTNVYHPFPDSNAVWRYAGEYYGYYSGNWFYFIQNDTLINSKLYHKLHTTYDTTFASSTYKGAFRQDTILRRVYFIKATDLSEFVLYDFLKEEGDTVVTILGNQLIIDGIDSMKIKDEYRKVFNLQSDRGPVQYVEGIGTSLGDLINQASYSWDEYIGLSCFKQNNVSIIHVSSWLHINDSIGYKYYDFCAYDSFIVNLFPSKTSMEPRFILYYDIFSDNIIINFYDMQPHPYKLEIYNVLGVKITEFIIQNHERDYLNINRIKKGIYFFKLSNKYGKLQTGKFITIY